MQKFILHVCCMKKLCVGQTLQFCSQTNSNLYMGHCRACKHRGKCTMHVYGAVRIVTLRRVNKKDTKNTIDHYETITTSIRCNILTNDESKQHIELDQISDL